MLVSAFIKPESLKSLSARRAWIEILASWSAVLTELVALRKESVDRNVGVAQGSVAWYKMSLSARRAWIEIPTLEGRKTQECVALRKESVDRNLLFRLVVGSLISRSPQGERG